MVSKRKPIHSSNQTSLKEIATLIVLHMCRKSIFFDTNLKVALYLGTLFAVSLLADVFNVPKCYLAKSSNVFNQYFVKLAWGWNLMLLIPYTLLTTVIYCCGQKNRILKHHFLRLLIATFFWWFWTTFFLFIENRYGRCVKGERFKTRQSCLKAGYLWNGFDISGHSFILIYGSLVLIEETKSILNWDSIKEHICLEEHYRATKDNTLKTNPLRSLSDSHFKYLKCNYEKLTPYIRGLFILITIFQVLWDVMLVSTILYFHVMIEKFVGGVCAILTWYLTYRFWYSQTNFLPKMPGDGLFKYIKVKNSNINILLSRKRSGSIVNDSAQGLKTKSVSKLDNGNAPNFQADLSR